MRLAIIADIHGNYRALQAVLADLAPLAVDRIVSLGDTIGYGPEPEEVVQTLRAHQVVSVMGNHELALVSQGYCNRLHLVAAQSLALTRTLLSPESLAWLAQLPAQLVCGGARCVHGCPPQSITVYLYNPSDTRLSRLFASYPEPLCFAGHTHDFGFYQQQGSVLSRRDLRLEQVVLDPQSRYLLQPGSVGQPRDPLNWQAKYMLWDDVARTLEVRAVAYDVQTTIRLLGERHFPAANARRLWW